MNYRELLRKYMAHVICCEGTAFVPDKYDEDFGCLRDDGFFAWNEEDQKALIELADEVSNDMKENRW